MVHQPFTRARHLFLSWARYKQSSRPIQLLEKSFYWYIPPTTTSSKESLSFRFSKKILYTPIFPYVSRASPFLCFLIRQAENLVSGSTLCSLHHYNAKSSYNNNNNGEWNICHVEAKGSTSDPDSNIIYGSNSEVTMTESSKT